MNGSSFGTNFKITTFGESHGAALGVIVDGCPAGLSLSEGYVQGYLNRRRPGQNAYSTPRRETDAVEILSGTFEGRTTGTPIAMIIRNETQRSADYSEIASYYRPGHADYTFDAKYGFRDYRGGGRSSGRETAARVAAGAVAAALLSELGIQVCAYASSIHTFSCAPADAYLAEVMPLSDLIAARDQSPLHLPDAAVSKQAAAYLDQLRAEKNSAGGTIECVIRGLPAGLGDPVFEKFDARLAMAMLSIGAVKGFEIGTGFRAATLTGAEQNDAFLAAPPVGAGQNDALPAAGNGAANKRTNHAGGILGGITDGSDVLFRVAIKPTPSIAQPQETIRKDGTPCTVEIKGRHDPIIVPRAVVVVESMAALVAADALLSNAGSRLDKLKKLYLTE